MSDSHSPGWFDCRRRLAAWYATPLGRELDAVIRVRVRSMLESLHAHHALQIGTTINDSDLLAGAAVGHRFRLAGEAGDTLAADPDALPVASDTLNLIVLCHVLEFHAEPEAVLGEVERVLAGEGHALVICFNPASLFGLRRALPHDGVPWSGSFHGALRVERWARGAGLETAARGGCWRRPPAHGPRVRHALAWMERGHGVFDYCAAVQLYLLCKHRSPLNPLPLGERLRRRLPAAAPARPTPTARRSNRIVRASRQPRDPYRGDVGAGLD